MGKYVFKRILQIIPLIVVVSFVIYALMDLTPGDPIYSVYGNISQEEHDALYDSMGYNDSIAVRYLRYMKGVLQGDLGTSLYSSQDVWDEFMSRVPYTIALAIAAMIFCVALAVPLGVFAATRQNTWFDAGSSATSIVGQSIPNFWLGLLLIILFSIKLGWLPSSGASQGFKSLILPTVTLGVANMALVMRTTRSSMLDCLRADYLRTGRAKGVTERKIIWRHAFKNALIPIVTVIGSQFSILIAGAAVVESVFSWPGVGQLIITSIRNSDYDMATGCLLLTTILTTSILLITDISYALVDPRIKARYTKS